MESQIVWSKMFHVKQRQKVEDRGQRAEDRGQRTKERGQRVGLRSKNK